MEFHKNELIDKTLDAYANTWSHTLDTEDFINPKSLKRIDKYIDKNLKNKFSEIDIYHLLYLQDKGIKLGLFQKLKIFFSGLKPLYLAEKEELKKQEKLKEREKRERTKNKKKKKRKTSKKD